MGSLVKKQAEKFLREKQRHRRWLAIFLCLALLVTSGTFAALRMDGRAMDDEGNMVYGTETHEHTAECYDGGGVLICSQQEDQYPGGEQAEDALQEVAGDDGGLEGEGIVQPETAGTDPQETDDPSVGNIEIGQNGDGNGPEDPQTGMAGMSADQEDGQKRLEDVELTGDWRTDVVEIAKSQIGRTEDAGDLEGYERYAQWYSQYVQEHGGTYADSGDYREDWTSLFVSFCLDYAKVEGIPLQADSRVWMESLAQDSGGLYREASYYNDPQPGDIVFYTLPAEDGDAPEGVSAEEENAAYELSAEKAADSVRAALVEEWNAETGEIKIVAGDMEKDGIDQVCEAVYSMPGGDINLLGASLLPEKAQETVDTTEPAAPEESGNIAEGPEGTPEETQAAETTEPEETQEAEETAGPEETQETEETTEPEETQKAEETVKPKETQEAEETAGPEDTQGAEDEYDDSDNMTIEELKALEETQVGSTVYREKGIAAGIARTVNKMFGLIRPQPKQWTFDTYYVNQDDAYNVTMTDDLNLKYQMEFHTDASVSANEVEIRIPAALFKYRGTGEQIKEQAGEYALPAENDIAVPKGTKDKFVSSKATPFNYYIDESGEEPVLVFFNYRDIKAGSNAAWQVLYRNIQIMEVVDGSSWDLAASIKVKNQEGSAEHTLSGNVDSSVYLDNVSKEIYKEPGKIYTPGLYTESQVKRYIGGELPEKYAGENFDKWKYMLWEVRIRGSATQPWDLVLEEAPSVTILGGEEDRTVSGNVVGYLNNTSYASGYDVEINTENHTGNDKVISQSKRKDWGNRFWVVTAYPAEGVKEGDILKNALNVRLVPVDDAGQSAEKSVHAQREYQDYLWTYSGDMIGVEKISDPSESGWEARKKKEYKGWLEAYSRADEDYGDLYYSTKGTFKGYANTHTTSTNGTVGIYREGTSYELTTVDDHMYAYPNGNKDGAIMLDQDDYYYSGVTIRQTDVGYDPSEEIETGLKNPEGSESIDKSVHVYAMFGKPEKEEQKDQWVKVGECSLNDSGTGTYSFTPDQIAQEPWRVKVVHKAVEYRTACTIDVHVRLKHSSSRLQELAKQYKDGGLSYVQLENLSGVMGKAFKADGTFHECHGDASVTGQDGRPINYANYPGLEDLSKELYKEDGFQTAPQRDNANVLLYGLEKEAQAHKGIEKVTNDVHKTRVLVDYCLTAYDGYRIFDEDAKNYLGSLGLSSPGQKHLMFYDLLPAGMYFDASEPVTAGRILELDRNKYYRTRPGYWEREHVSVAVDTKKDIVENWNGTGRTMVVFHITYNGEDPSVYTDGKWLEGWGVSFRAYYEWKNTKAVKAQPNICAFMPDAETGGSQTELLGEPDMVYPDNGSFPDTDYKDFGDRLNEHNTDPDVKNVLYAKNRITEDTAQASSSTIEKLVRADTDTSSVYSESAYVEEEGDYTYSVTVKADTDLKDIVVFDHLENAKMERGTVEDDPNYGFGGVSWNGTFRYVELGGLQEQGVAPVVWYNTSRNASTSGWVETENGMDLRTKKDAEGNPVTDAEGDPQIESAAPSQILVSENGWYTEAGLIEKYRSENSTEGLDDGQVKEKAFAQVKSVAVDLSKRNAGQDGSQEDFILGKGDSVTFRIRMRAPEKKTEKEDTYAYNNSSFYSAPQGEGSGTTQIGDSVRVHLGDKGSLEVAKEFEGDVPPEVRDTEFGFQICRGEDPIGHKGYTLWSKNEAGEWERIEAGIPHASDADGKFTLQAGQKAVFDNVADAAGVTVSEGSNLLWKVEEEQQVEEGKTTWIMSNTYRPVLYVQKKTQGVPEGVDVSSNKFRFQIKVDGEEKAVEYAKVDGVNIGDPPSVKEEDILKTDPSGRFEIGQSETIALFMDKTDAAYTLYELDGDGHVVEAGGVVGRDWICNQPTVSGTVPYSGSQASITNYYRWKDLYLTKSITHREPSECGESFTFKIEEKKSEGAGIPISGNAWVMLDGNGNEEDQGTVSADGTFACACAGKTVIIKGLKANTTYTVEEKVEDQDAADYLPVNAKGEIEVSQDVRMPLYGSSQEVKFINDYRMRSLSVSKVVVSDGPVDENKEFRMIVCEEEDGQYSPLAGKPYTLQETGGASIPGNWQTDEKGGFALKNGQTAVFEDAGKVGARLAVWEVQDGQYPQIYPAAGTQEDMPVLPEACIDEGAEAGTPCVSELPDSGDGGQMQFINGVEGKLMISKKYEAREEDKGKERVEDFLKQAKEEYGARNEIWVSQENYGTSLKKSIEAYVKVSDLAQEISQNLGDIDVVKKTWEEVKEQMEMIDLQARVDITNLDDAMDAYFEGNDDYAIFNVDAYLDRFINKVSSKREELSRQLEQRNGARFSLWADDEYDVKAHLKVDGADWIPNTNDTITFIDQILGDIYTAQYDPVKKDWAIYYEGEELTPRWDGQEMHIFEWGENGDLNIVLKPWITYVLPISLEGDAEYELEEVDLFRGGIDAAWDYVVVSQKIPKEGESIHGTVKKDSVATIVNEVRASQKGCVIEKRMTEDSLPVSQEAKLVWRIEQYQAGSWHPAEGVEYMVGANDGPFFYEPITGVRKTASDGLIVLELPEGYAAEVPLPYLAVQFFGMDRVYVNKEEGTDGEYRVVEVLEQSSEDWGVLAGYGLAGEYYAEGYSMDLSADVAGCFVNTNRITPVDVEKRTGAEKPFGKQFTMVLEQVLIKGDMKERLPRQGISYTVHDKATGIQSGGTKTTSEGGEIKIEDGQYARLYLPSALMWDVYEKEDLTPNFALTDLGKENDKGAMITIKGLDRACINHPDATEGTQEKTTALTRFDVIGGVYAADTGDKISLKNGAVQIPAYILRNGVKYKVVEVAEAAFQRCTGLESVVIPDSVEKIGSYAFAGCTGLENVQIKGLIKEIERFTFWDCAGLKTINIPGSVTRIANRAFESCRSLQNIGIPDSVEELGEGAFFGCESLTDVSIPEKITRIEKYTFASCESLTAITIPEKVDHIGQYAFAGCISLKTVTVQGGIGTIEKEAFVECKELETVMINGGVDSIGERAFYGCIGLDTVTINGGVGSIGDHAFSVDGYSDGTYCEEKTVTIKGNVGSIGAYAFSESASFIGDGEFEHWGNLKTITIEGNVDSIGEAAFAECFKLETVTIKGNVGSIGGHAFGCNEIWNTVYQWQCRNLKTVNISGSVTDIGEQAFAGCRELSDLTIGGGIVGTIGDNAFKGCEKLQSINDILKNTKYIGSNAFDACVKLEDVKIPGSVETIDYHAFNSCSGLGSLTIAEGVKTIGDGAFYGCSNLGSVKIPGSVGTIGSFAFANCSSLGSLEIAKGVKTIGESAFNSCSNLGSVKIPGSVETVGAYAFSNCSGLGSLEIEMGVKTIRESAFYNCKELASEVEIPESVAEIGAYAFYDCDRLPAVIVKNKAISIASTAFEDCDHTIGSGPVRYAGMVIEVAWNLGERTPEDFLWTSTSWKVPMRVKYEDGTILFADGTKIKDKKLIFTDGTQIASGSVPSSEEYPRWIRGRSFGQDGLDIGNGIVIGFDGRAVKKSSAAGA